jgi:transcriptional regulator with XRE-family HTH domain
MQITNVIVIITNVIAIALSITFVNTFGSRLRHARTLRRLTQAELARACGLSQGAIGNYESDSRRSTKHVFRIAEVLRVEPAWLAMGTGPMERQAGARVAEPPSGEGWPFPEIDPARIQALTPEQRQIISSTLESLLAALESAADGTHA